jgi:hypothetical protein
LIFYFLETITGILNEIQRSQEDLLRKRALRMFLKIFLFITKKKTFLFSGFLCSRIATLDQTDLSKDNEEHLVKTCKDVRNSILNFCFLIKFHLSSIDCNRT